MEPKDVEVLSSILSTGFSINFIVVTKRKVYKFLEKLTLMVASTVVRAYDLGGFGDIAGAMRVASFLQRTGIDTRIKAKSKSALEKLQILNPDVEFSLNGDGKNNGTIQVDVAGHYRDDRNPFNGDIPHHFTEDMDNPSNRRKVVPIYLKTGLTNNPTQIPVQLNVQSNPMFYRPFREWDLPKPGERDVRKQIIQAIQKIGRIQRLFGINKLKGLERVLQETERIGFAHLSPQIQNLHPAEILEHPYFYAVHAAKLNYGHTFGIGLFSHPSLEARLSRVALQKHWNVVSRNGEVLKFDPDIPTLIFLGQQPQMTTTGLFLSSNIPNLVTGDLSLSDALYGLIAMEGQGFFYETPDWKMPTFQELARILGRSNRELANIYFAGSNDMNASRWEISPDLRNRFNQIRESLTKIFGDEKLTQAYTHDMREAVRGEIKRRFGDVPVELTGQNGFYIPPGAPYLLQDATAKVVETLREDPDTLSEVESVRKMLSDGVPVTVNVQTGVLEPAPPQTDSFPEKPIFYDGLDLMDNVYNPKILEKKYYKNEIYNIIKYNSSNFEKIISKKKLKENYLESLIYS